MDDEAIIHLHFKLNILHRSNNAVDNQLHLWSMSPIDERLSLSLVDERTSAVNLSIARTTAHAVALVIWHCNASLLQ